jgi:hypothetical protein
VCWLKEIKNTYKGVKKMNYEELIKYIQSKCKENIFNELDNFLTGLGDTMEDTIELESNKFRIRKDIVDTDYDNGIVKCKYTIIL